MSKNIQEVYDPNIYMKLSYDDLVTFGLYSLIKK